MTAARRLAVADALCGLNARTNPSISLPHLFPPPLPPPRRALQSLAPLPLLSATDAAATTGALATLPPPLPAFVLPPPLPPPPPPPAPALLAAAAPELRIYMEALELQLARHSEQDTLLRQLALQAAATAATVAAVTSARRAKSPARSKSPAGAVARTAAVPGQKLLTAAGQLAGSGGAPATAPTSRPKQRARGTGTLSLLLDDDDDESSRDDSTFHGSDADASSSSGNGSEGESEGDTSDASSFASSASSIPGGETAVAAAGRRPGSAWARRPRATGSRKATPHQVHPIVAAGGATTADPPAKSRAAGVTPEQSAAGEAPHVSGKSSSASDVDNGDDAHSVSSFSSSYSSSRSSSLGDILQYRSAPCTPTGAPPATPVFLSPPGTYTAVAGEATAVLLASSTTQPAPLHPPAALNGPSSLLP